MSTVCLCGALLAELDLEDGLSREWFHTSPRVGNCTDPRPAEQQRPGGRQALTERMREVGDQFAKVSQEMDAMRIAAEHAAEHMAALAESVKAHEDVRRATLNQVWDKLMDRGNIAGAQLVRTMLDSLPEGDWS